MAGTLTLHNAVNGGSLTVAGSAVADAGNGGIQDHSATDFQVGAGVDSTGGIVWNGTANTEFYHQTGSVF